MTLAEIKDQVARDNGFSDWDSVRNYEAIPTDDENDLIDEVAYRYAEAMIEADREDGAEKAMEAMHDQGIYGYAGDIKASILNRPYPELK